MKKIDIQKLTKEAVIYRLNTLVDNDDHLVDPEIDQFIYSEGPQKAFSQHANKIYDFYKHYPNGIIRSIPDSIMVMLSSSDIKLLRTFIAWGCRDSGYNAIKDYIRDSAFSYGEDQVLPTIF